jgi:hypothetical protein
MSSLRRGFVLSLAVSLIVTAAGAQVTTADVVGTVTDSNGAVLTDLKVVIQNPGTGSIRTATTNSSGEFLFTLLPIGRYTLRVENTDFKPYTASIELAAGDRARLNVQLELGQLKGETVEIQADAAALQTDSSTGGALINQKAVQDLPLNGRNFILLAQLAPGASGGGPRALSSGNRPDDRRRTSALSVNGQRELFNNYLIDGVDNNERTIGTIVVRPSMDAIAEMKVQTSLYTAEVGRTAGGVVNIITKSGTNEFHGSVFEFFRDDRLEAKNFFARTNPELRQNQFGGSIGGPIKKDRTFFFGDYERLQSRQELTFITTAPTDAMKRGDFSGAGAIYDPLTTSPAGVRTRFPGDIIPQNRIDPVAARYMALIPSPNLPGSINNYNSHPLRTQNDNTFDARIDHRFNESNFVFGRYSFNDTTTYTPSILPPVNGIDAGGNNAGFTGLALQRAQGFQMNYLHIFNEALMLELIAGYSRYSLQSLPPNYGKNVSEEFGLTGANFDEQSSGLTPVSLTGFASPGDSIFLPIIARNNTFDYMGNLTYMTGSHSIKVGGALKRRQFTIFQSASAAGRFFFDSGTTANSSSPGSGHVLASFLLGYPRVAQRSTSLVWPGMRSWETGGYIQDDWRATPKLTLNIGVRYDLFTPFTEVADRIANLDLATGKIIAAGRDGVSHTAGIATDYSNLAPRFGFAASLTPSLVIRGGYGISYFPSNYTSNAFLKNPPFVSLYNSVNNPVIPTFRISDGLPLPVPTDASNPVGGLTPVALDFRSTHAHQFNLTVQKDFGGFVASAGYLGELARHVLNLRNINVAAPGPGPVQPRTPYFGKLPGVSQITLMSSDANSSYHGLQLVLERRFRNGLTLSSNYTWSHSIDDGSGGGASSRLTGDGFGQLINNRAIERGNSEQDIRHRWVLMTNYELPFGRTLSGFKKGLISGWQVNAIAFWNTGSAFTVTNATDRANVGAPGRPNRIKEGGVSNPSVAKWFDTSAFVLQPQFTVGNAGRNILYGPPQRELALSMFKYFSLTEGLRLQVRAESFNVTNTPNFSQPNSVLGAPGFGSITSTNGSPRQIQFALKLLF